MMVKLKIDDDDQGEGKFSVEQCPPHMQLLLSFSFKVATTAHTAIHVTKYKYRNTHTQIQLLCKVTTTTHTVLQYSSTLSILAFRGFRYGSILNIRLHRICSHFNWYLYVFVFVFVCICKVFVSQWMRVRGVNSCLEH